MSLKILYNVLLDDFGCKGDHGRIFVYVANLTQYKNKIRNLYNCLSDSEKKKATEYYTKELSDKYIISHGILRYILSYYTTQLPENIKFYVNEYGKPFLVNNDLYFNMSYSKDLVCYVISFEHVVGIDLEFRDKNLKVDELVDTTFTADEHNFYTFLPQEEKKDFFYTLWTIKESLVKAAGYGLSYPINTIETKTSQKIILYKKGAQKQNFYSFFSVLFVDYTCAIAIKSR